MVAGECNLKYAFQAHVSTQNQTAFLYTNTVYIYFTRGFTEIIAQFSGNHVYAYSSVLYSCRVSYDEMYSVHRAGVGSINRVVAKK